MGVLDVPAPLFAQLDGLLGQFAPPTARLAIWGLISALVSMGVYWLLSPQQKIAEVKAKALAARRDLDSYEGDFAGAWPRMREMLGLSLKQVGIVTGPAIVASLPVLCLLVWMSIAYGYHYPSPKSEVGVRIYPEQLEAKWTVVYGTHQPKGPSDAPRIEVRDRRGEVMETIPLPQPVTTVHKRQWWNTLVGNPAGYLPENGAIDRVEVNLPQQELLPFGPSWMRSWEFLYFTVLVLGSIAIKIAFGIK
jgi:hypothetical protein